ncbi:MAG: DUF4440 domain-containing protein [Rhizobiales bacterium]|nr:DUF4440 domain-containing protein [Hyphomicrobiales bacterium]
MVKMTSVETDVRRAVDDWFAALNAMLAGDPQPFADLCSHGDDVVYMGGEGTFRIGFEAAFADWKAQAAKSRGGKTLAEDVRIVVSGDMAAIGIVARATIIGPDGRSGEYRIRQSHVLRKEGSGWKMVLHQADNTPVWKSVVSS